MLPTPSPNQLILHCRAGFESECAQEIQDKALNLGVYGFIKTAPNTALVHFQCHTPSDALRLIKELDFNALVFTRQWFASFPLLSDLPSEDRVSPILAYATALAQQLGCTFGYVSIETADTNNAKQALTFCKKFTSPLTHALKKSGVLEQNQTYPQLHVLFLNSSACYVGMSFTTNHSPHFMGIPRLKMPASAPSRSTLKLEEGWLTLLSHQERAQYLQAGMNAVDLGAAPGGWTWQFVQRSIRVTAVDNGPINQDLMDSGIVTHLQVDGFTFWPNKAVDWLVCDMVEQPQRISELMAKWVSNDKTRFALFNLKLPMKKRYECLSVCRQNIAQTLTDSSFEMRIKHLYHDREEVTVFLKKNT